MFAGKFFGGEVAVEAQKIWDVPNFTRTIMEKNIKMVADGDNTFSGGNSPLSELGSATCLQKTGSETGFWLRILRQATGQRFLGLISDRKAEQVFKTWTGS